MIVVDRLGEGAHGACLRVPHGEGARHGVQTPWRITAHRQPQSQWRYFALAGGRDISASCELLPLPHNRGYTIMAISKSKAVAAAIRKYLISGVALQAGVDTAQAKLDTARGGMYACTVQAAIAANGDKAAFVDTCDTLMADFRSNSRGIAAKYNLDQATTKQGTPAVNKDGDPIYKVPPSLSVAKSVLGGAFDHEIDLGSIKEPQSFGAIRDAATSAREERTVANATPADKVRASVQEHLNTIGAQLASLDIKALRALNSLLGTVAKENTATPTAARKAA